LVPYGERIVRPHLHTEEVLFTSDLLKKRQALYGELFKSKEEKIEAMQDLVDMKARPVIRHHLIPMLRDKDFDIRLNAAMLIVYLERTEGIADLKCAIDLEQDEENRDKLKKQLLLLESILGRK